MSSQDGPGGFQRSAPNAPDPESIRSLAAKCGLDEKSLRYRLKKGMTLDEAMTLVRQRGGRRSGSHTGGGHAGNKSEETFEQYFVDTLRKAIGKDPLYRKG